MKKFILPIVLLCLFLFIPPKVQASVIFQDNFESDTNGWTPISGSSFWTMSQGKYGAQINSYNTIIRTHADFIIPTSDYTIDFDMYTVSGTDKNITFRLNDDSTTGYEIHFTGNAVSGFGKVISYSALQNYPLSSNHPYHIKIVLVGQHMQFFVDSEKLFDEVDPNYQFAGHERLGLMMGTGDVAPTEIWFDNVVISTPDVVNSDLNVPLFKQTDPLWTNDIYDSAQKWSTGATGIGRWGCAMTSAAMILKYNKIDKLPNDQDLTPGTLNTWLKSVPDGYTRNGYVNWLAITRMTKIAKVNNLGVTFDALEYKRVSGTNSAQLSADINNGIPAILEESGHFIVAKGINGTTFNINDPYYTRTTLVDYGNTYNSFGEFVPSYTDLSYLMFVVNPTVSIALKDSLGNQIGEVFTEHPITDPLNILNNSVGPLKIVSFPKPSTGNYTVEVSSTNPTPYYLQGYLYDINGNVTMFDEKDVLAQNDTDIYKFFFNKYGNQNIQLHQDMTFTIFRNDVEALCSLSNIQKEFCKGIIEKINEIEKQYNKEHKNVVKQLSEFYKELSKEKKLDSYASTILLSDIQGLIDSLSQVITPGS